MPTSAAVASPSPSGPQATRPAFFRTATLVRSVLMPSAPAQPPPRVVHPLMPAMYWACSEILGFIPDMIAASAALPSALELRSTLTIQLSVMAERARSVGVLPDDAAEAEYAIVATIDEVLARARGWAGQPEWRSRPLQLVRFNENTAGENFYRRLATLEGQPHRAHVLQIYFLCLAIGFQGRYAVTGADGLAQTYDRVGAHVSRALGPDVLSPRGEPRDRRGILRTEAPLVRIALAAFGLALVAFVGLRVALGLLVREATRPMHAYATTTRAMPSGKR